MIIRPKQLVRLLREVFFWANPLNPPYAIQTVGNEVSRLIIYYFDCIRLDLCYIRILFCDIVLEKLR